MCEVRRKWKLQQTAKIPLLQMKNRLRLELFLNQPRWRWCTCIYAVHITITTRIVKHCLGLFWNRCKFSAIPQREKASVIISLFEYKILFRSKKSTFSCFSHRCTLFMNILNTASFINRLICSLLQQFCYNLHFCLVGSVKRPQCARKEKLKYITEKRTSFKLRRQVTEKYKSVQKYSFTEITS